MLQPVAEFRAHTLDVLDDDLSGRLNMRWEPLTSRGVPRLLWAQALTGCHNVSFAISANVGRVYHM